MKKKLLLFLCVVAMLSIIPGCKKEETTEAEVVDPNQALIDQMEDGMFYVKHVGDDKVEPVYFGAATFDKGNTTTNKEQISHVMWFMDDYEKIPTLRPGDSLIMHSNSSFNERFTFERFEDMGYSIGLCHITPGESGRYKLATDPAKKQTYPGSDADQLLNFNNNEIIIDEIGGQVIRQVDETQTSASWISKYGTVKNLTKDQLYDVVVYEGTNRSDFKLTANVRILGSMTGLNTAQYYFDNNVINVKIPENYNSGFYMINGLGIFRYINNSAGNIDDNNPESYNIPNDDDVTFNQTAVVRDGIGYNVEGNQVTGTSIADMAASQSQIHTEESKETDVEQTVTQKFTIKNPSVVSVSATMDVSNSIDGHYEEIVGQIIGPDGMGWTMDYDEETDTFNKRFKATEIGDYTITFSNLYGVEPEISVMAKQIKDEDQTEDSEETGEENTSDDKESSDSKNTEEEKRIGH